MASLRPQTESYLTGVEKFVSKKMRYRVEIGTLIDLAEQQSLQQRFDELTFLSKFAAHAYNILKRNGYENEQTEKLSAEFSSTLKKILSLVEMIASHAPPETARTFQQSFFDRTHESMQQLLLLLTELSWIKNYELDHHRSPFSSPANTV